MARPNLDNIPEDASLAIIKYIQSFAERGGDREAQEKARVARDFTIRSVSLSSRSLFPLWNKSLLENVTMTLEYLLSFYEHLERDPDYGKSIKSLHLTHIRAFQVPYEQLRSAIRKYSTLKPQAANRDHDFSGMHNLVSAVYAHLPNIQVLMVDHSDFLFPPFNFNGSPAPFLAQSLRKIYIPIYNTLEQGLTARNVVWILVFCQNLDEASLGLTISIACATFLEDHFSAFEGRSNVKKLSLQFLYAWDSPDTNTWWGLPEENTRRWIGGNRKTQTMFRILSSTNGLTALELCPQGSNSRNPSHREEDESRCWTSCLSSLQSSYSTLKHLRLFFLTPDATDMRSTDYSQFFKLRVLTSDDTFLERLRMNYGRESTATRIALPDSIETLILPYYKGLDDANGPVYDRLLTELLKTPVLPNLKKLVVPSKFTDVNCRRIESLDELREWNNSRIQLKKLENSGVRKLKLHFVDLGDVGSDSFDGEPFLSISRGYSP